MLGKKVLLLVMACVIVCSFCGCAVYSSYDPSNTSDETYTIEINWALVDKILVIKDRDTQSSWEITDEEQITTISKLFQNMMFSTANDYGSAGSYLRLKFYGGSQNLAEIVLTSPNEIQFVSDNKVKTAEILDGAWSSVEWEVFLSNIS